VINFRYHLVSLASVFLALAVGIVLGAHYLDPDSVGGDTGGSNDSGLVSFQSGYAGVTGGPLIAGSLKGVGVVIFTLPGAEEKQVADISADIAQAGGRVTGEVGFTSKLLDAGNRQFAESVAEGVLPNAPGSGYDKVGAALAAAFVGSGDPDAKAGPIRSAFTEGGLIRVATAPKTRAPLVLIVAGSATDQSSSGSVLADLAATLAEAGNGAVIAGPSTASTGGGLLAAVRDSSSAGDFGTVDVTDTAAGRVIVVLALKSVSEGSTGSWGTSRSHDGAVPGD
jgi:hypothetical protein